MYKCKFNDCGWCYAPNHLETTDNNGQCNHPQQCKQNEYRTIVNVGTKGHEDHEN